jgi:hypothetical protein
LDEVLVDRERDQFNPVSERVPLQLAQVRPVPRGERLFFRDVHLPVQNVDAIHTELGRHMDSAQLEKMIDHANLALRALPNRSFARVVVTSNADYAAWTTTTAKV